MGGHWPLTGRDEESILIGEILASADYRGVVLAGRPGVGKSRLAREAASAAAASGWSVRHVAATATGRSVPLGAFAPWADVSEGAPLALARKVITELTANTDGRPLLVVVDDIHLLDELSALVVHQLVLQNAATVIATLRSGQPSPDAVTTVWKDGLLRRLELQPLSRSESTDLLGAVIGQPPDRDCADRMWRMTAGNVLFLRQLVEQERAAGRLIVSGDHCRWIGSPQVSQSLVELVEHQIGAIGDKVRDVVDLVAVAEPADRTWLTALADPLAIEQAEQRELIRTDGDAVFVGHPMYAEVRLSRCGPLRLRRLRGQVASVMTAGTSSANTVRRGLLWLESDLPPDPEVFAGAATAASSLLDFGLAERLSRAADEAGVGVEARVHLAYNLLMLQKGEAAADVIDSLATEQVSPTSFINDVVLKAANLLWTMRDPAESWRVIDEALDVATGARRAQLLAFRANQQALAAQPADVLQTMASVDYSALDGFGSTIGLCSETLALAELGRPDEAVAKATACYRVIDTSQQSSFLGQPLVEFHTFALSVAGRIAEAIEIADGHLARSSEKPTTARVSAAAIVGMAALGAGDLQRALAHLPRRPADTDADFVLANSFYRFGVLRAQALALTGDVAAAEAALRSADSSRHPSYVYIGSVRLLAEAWLAAAHNQLDDARRSARGAASFAREHGQLAREVLCLQTAVQLNDTGVAARLDELAAVVDGPRAPLAARYAHALRSADAEMLDRLSTEFETMDDRLAAADAAGQAAAAHRKDGRTGSAMTSASRARRLAAACGDARTPAIEAARIPLPFTQREREIAVLVARGLSNREIATVSSLSVRTIEGHIYRASCKVGVTRRSELASVVNEFISE